MNIDDLTTNLDDLWDAHGPSAADLKELERLEEHRVAFIEMVPEGEHQTSVWRRILEVLDDMEECLCEEGRGAPALAEGWQLLGELEARLWEQAAPRTEAPVSPSRPHPAGSATGRSPKGITANQTISSPRAA